MFVSLSLSLLFLHPASLVAREIVFPPIAPLQANPHGHGHDVNQYRSHAGADRDFEKFSGLSTFSNLPWVHCLSPEEHVDKYDIAFLGAPFDTATTGRPGARFGPAGIRA